MAEAMRKIAIISSDGSARARLQEAAISLDANVVFNAAVTANSVGEVLVSGANAWLVALDHYTEQLLDALEDAATQSGILLVFEELDVLMARQGWDYARWLRHLGAKLGLRESTLPPGTEPVPADAAPEVLLGVPVATAAADSTPQAASAVQTKQPDVQHTLEPSQTAAALAQAEDAAQTAQQFETIAFADEADFSLQLEPQEQTAAAPFAAESQHESGLALALDDEDLGEFSFGDETDADSPAQNVHATAADADIDALDFDADLQLALHDDAVQGAEHTAEIQSEPLAFDASYKAQDTMLDDAGDAMLSFAEEPLQDAQEASARPDTAQQHASDSVAAQSLDDMFGASFDASALFADEELPASSSASGTQAVQSDDGAHWLDPSAVEDDFHAQSQTWQPPQEDAVSDPDWSSPATAAPAPLPASDTAAEGVGQTASLLEFESLSLTPMSDEPLQVVATSPAAKASAAAVQSEAAFPDVQALVDRVSDWSLEPVEEERPKPVATATTIVDLEQDIADAENTVAAAAAAAAAAAHTGQKMVVLYAGIGGPDAVRHLLAGLPTGFSRPVLVLQNLSNATHGRLVIQLQRATELPVDLAENGVALQPGRVYVVPPELGLDTEGTHFLTDGQSPELAAQVGGSIFVVLSGAAETLVGALAARASQGAVLLAQSSAGCYDSKAARALAAQGVTQAGPAELATQIAALASA